MASRCSVSGSVCALPKFLLFAVCVLLSWEMIAVPAHAQNVSFAGVQTTVPAIGLQNTLGVAVDAAGDVFIADTYNGRVVEVPAGGGQQSTVGSGFCAPTGVAVDGAGNVFIADYCNYQVVEVPAGGGPQTIVPVSGLSRPHGVAVDGAGDVFITDFFNGRVVEVTPGGVQTTVPASGLNEPIAVAVDGAGDVFIADPLNNRVVEVPAGCTTAVCQITVGSGLSFPSGVAVDGAGNVFIGDYFNNRLVEVTPSGVQTTLLTSGLSNPFGVAVDGVGDVFIGDRSNNRVVELQRVAANFGNVNVCPGGQTTPAPCSQTLTLNYNVAATTTFGTTNVVTQGAPNLDFALSSGSTCTGPVSAGSTCTVNITFAPLAPGVRTGAVQLTDNLGNVLVTTMIHGIGQGPAITFGPGVQTTVPTTGLINSYGIALDGAGDIFIADPSNQRVVKVPADGGPQTTVGTGVTAPFKVAVDGAGDVFIADYLNNQVVKVLAGGGPQTTVGSGLNGPFGVAIDGAGNVFIADRNNNRVVEVPADGSPQITVGSGLTLPMAVAVDGAGNVFATDRSTYPDRLVKIPANGGPQTTVVGGLNNPTGVVVDAAGDVFVADFDGGRILEVPADGGPPTTVGSGMYDPFDMALDGVGNVFIMDWGNSRVVKVQRSQPPTMSFATTVDGSTSSDSPQSVTIQNIGNQPLNAIAPGLIVGGPDFVQVAGPGTPADCTSSFSLTPGASCDLSISFTPSGIALARDAGGFRSVTGGGVVTSAATFTDNALNNIPYGSQSIALQGTRLGTQTITFTQNAPPQAVYNSSFNVAATGGASGNPVTFTSSGACSNVGATYTMTSGTGTCSVIANQAGDSNYAAAPALTVTVAAVPASQTITFNQNAPAAAAYNSNFTVTATGTSGNPVAFTSSGSCSNVGATYTMISGAGTCSVIANQPGNTNYSAAPQVTETVNATQASQSITFTQSAPSFAPYNGSFTVVAAASSGLPVTFGSSGVCTNAGATFTMTNSKGTCTVTVSQSGNANYLAAPSILQTTTAAKAAPAVTFTGAPATAPYQSTFTVAATTNSGITPTIAATGSCSISGTTVTMTSGTGTCTMTAKWAANAYYLATTVAQTTTAEKLVSTVNWTAPAAITYGTALSGTQLNATASVPGNFVYSPAAGTIQKAGSDTLKVTFTPTLSKDYTTATASVVIQVNQATPAITWPTPAAIVYGTALSATQLDATANVAGKFAYSPASGKVLTAGTKTLSVTFTPTDIVDYTKVTTTVTLVVNKVGTSTAITSDLPNPSAAGQAVGVHFTVTPATNYTSPTGTVIVNASTGESCSATFSGGSGSCTVKFTTTGARTLTATYGGDSNNSSSISAPVTQTVN